MLRVIFFTLFFPLFLLAQQNNLIYYAQNNTGFPYGFSDFDVDNNGNIVLAGYYYSDQLLGGVTIFDGTHWSLTTKGENGFAFESAHRAFYSANAGTYFVYGSLYKSDVTGQRSFLQQWNQTTQTWEIMGDSVSFQYAGGLIDFYVSDNGDVYATGTGGFMRLTPGNAERIHWEDDPWFYPEYILPKPDGSMYLIDNWSDGWGGAHVALWTYNGAALDTIVTKLDSIFAPVSALLDNNGNIWMLEAPNIMPRNKLVKYSNGEIRTYEIPNENYSYALSMALDGDYLWFGMDNGYGNMLLVRFNTIDGNWSTFDLGKVPCFPYDSIIRKIVVKGDYLYLSSNFFLVKYDKVQNKVVDSWSSYTTGLPGGAPTDLNNIHIDKYGHYWISSLNSGVSMFNGDSWTTYSACDIRNDLVVTIWGITTDNNGRLFTVGDSLRYYDGIWHSFYPSSGIMYGNGIDVDANNKIWFADSYNGLGSFNPNDGSFTFYNSGIISRNASRVLAASDGKIWLGFGSVDQAIAAYFDGTNFINFAEADGFKIKATRAIAEGPNGEIWFAGINGIAKYQYGTWNSYTIEDENIPLVEVRAIAVDNFGTVWFSGIQEAGVDTLKIFSFDGNNFAEHSLNFTASYDVNYLTFDNNGNLWISTGYAIVVYNPNGDVIIGVEDNETETVRAFKLNQNYPNPFNPTTTISYSIPNVVTGKQSVNVTLDVYNALGQKIATLVNKAQAPGNYSVQFNAENLPSGVYFYTLRASNFVTTKKMVLMK